MVKAIDATSVDGHHWIFFGALTDVGYLVTVTDTATGAVRLYENVAGELCGRADTAAFPGP